MRKLFLSLLAGMAVLLCPAATKDSVDVSQFTVVYDYACHTRKGQTGEAITDTVRLAVQVGTHRLGGVLQRHLLATQGGCPLLSTPRTEVTPGTRTQYPESGLTQTAPTGVSQTASEVLSGREPWPRATNVYCS